MFEEIEHTGEVAFRVEGKNLEDIVKYSVYALRSLYRGKVEEGKETGEKRKKRKEEVRKKIIEIRSDGVDFPDALISLLNEIIYIFDARKLVVNDVKDVMVSGEGGREIKAKVEFEEFSPHIHNPEIYVKAVARGGVELRKNEKGMYEITFIVDI